VIAKQARSLVTTITRKPQVQQPMHADFW